MNNKIIYLLLKQRKIPKSHIIKVDFHILPPGQFGCCLWGLTFAVVVDHADIQTFLSGVVNTVIKLASKKIHSMILNINQKIRQTRSTFIMDGMAPKEHWQQPGTAVRWDEVKRVRSIGEPEFGIIVHENSTEKIQNHFSTEGLILFLKN